MEKNQQTTSLLLQTCLRLCLCLSLVASYDSYLFIELEPESLQLTLFTAGDVQLTLVALTISVASVLLATTVILTTESTITVTVQHNTTMRTERKLF